MLLSSAYLTYARNFEARIAFFCVSVCLTLVKCRALIFFRYRLTTYRTCQSKSEVNKISIQFLYIYFLLCLHDIITSIALVKRKIPVFRLPSHCQTINRRVDTLCLIQVSILWRRKLRYAFELSASQKSTQCDQTGMLYYRNQFNSVLRNRMNHYGH